MMRSAAVCSFLVALTACEPEPGGRDQTGASAYPSCEDTPSDVALDEVTDLGYSAADVLAGVPTSESVELTYARDSVTGLELGFAPGADARFVHSEAVYPDTGTVVDIGVICEDRIEVDGTFSFATDDGAFAEAFDATLSAPAGSVGLNVPLDLDALQGTFDIAPFVEAVDYDEVTAWIDVAYADGASSGSIAGQVSGTDAACDDETADCAAWAEAVPVATWGPSGG